MAFEWFEKNQTATVRVAKGAPVWSQLWGTYELKPDLTAAELAGRVEIDTYELSVSECPSLATSYETLQSVIPIMVAPDQDRSGSQEITIVLHPRLYVIHISDLDIDLRMQVNHTNEISSVIGEAVTKTRSCIFEDDA